MERDEKLVFLSAGKEILSVLTGVQSHILIQEILDDRVCSSADFLVHGSISQIRLNLNRVFYGDARRLRIKIYDVIPEEDSCVRDDSDVVEGKVLIDFCLLFC